MDTLYFWLIWGAVMGAVGVVAAWTQSKKKKTGTATLAKEAESISLLMEPILKKPEEMVLVFLVMCQIEYGPHLLQAPILAKL